MSAMTIIVRTYVSVWSNTHVWLTPSCSKKYSLSSMRPRLIVVASSWSTIYNWVMIKRTMLRQRKTIISYMLNEAWSLASAWFISSKVKSSCSKTLQLRRQSFRFCFLRALTKKNMKIKTSQKSSMRAREICSRVLTHVKRKTATGKASLTMGIFNLSQLRCADLQWLAQNSKR